MINFKEWYESCGYDTIDRLSRGGGVRKCATDLGITRSYVRMLLTGDKGPVKGSTLALLMGYVLISRRDKNL